MTSDDSTSRIFLLGKTKSEWLSCTGPCMLTFSVPLLIPGITLTIIASRENGIVGGDAFFAMGIVILVIAGLLFISGFTLCIFKNLKIPATVDISDSTLSLRDHMRIYMGTTLGNEDLFQANGVNNNPVKGTKGNSTNIENGNFNINNRNYKMLTKDYNLANGIYIQNPKPIIKNGGSKTQHQCGESKSEPSLTSLHNDNSQCIPTLDSSLERPSSHKIHTVREEEDISPNIQSCRQIMQLSNQERSPYSDVTIDLPLKVPEIATNNLNEFEPFKVIYSMHE